MQSQVVNQYTKNETKNRFNQGDIIKGISLIIHTGTNYQISEINFDYAVIVTQDCDLEHDYKNRINIDKKNEDKYLPNILILPAYLATKFRTGTHRGEAIKSISTWSTAQWKDIIQNNSARFHFINSNESFQIPELILDFKHLYTIDRNVGYNQISDIYLASICELHRELLSQRYSNFLGRIGLPENTMNE